MHMSIHENKFSSVVAKILGFLPTTYKLTPHIKGKKCTQKKFHPVVVDFQLKKQEKRKKKEETHDWQGRNPRCKVDHLGLPPRPSTWSRR
jgi:hypothetical protein